MSQVHAGAGLVSGLDDQLARRRAFRHADHEIRVRPDYHRRHHIPNQHTRAFGPGEAFPTDLKFSAGDRRYGGTLAIWGRPSDVLLEAIFTLSGSHIQ